MNVIKQMSRTIHSNMRRISTLELLFALGALLPTGAWADYDGVTVGQVALIQTSRDGDSGNNLGFVFTLVGYPALCTAGTSLASGWVDKRYGVTPEGVKTMLAAVMAAKLSGQNLKVYAYNSPTGWGCMVNVVEIQ